MSKYCLLNAWVRLPACQAEGVGVPWACAAERVFLASSHTPQPLISIVFGALFKMIELWLFMAP